MPVTRRPPGFIRDLMIFSFSETRQTLSAVSASPLRRMSCFFRVPSEAARRKFFQDSNA